MESSKVQGESRWFGALALGPIAAAVLGELNGHPDLWFWFLLPCSAFGFLLGRTIDQQDVTCDQKQQSQRSAQSSKDLAWQNIVRDYGAFLEQWFQSKEVGGIYDVRILPHPKRDIERALITGILTTNDADARNMLEGGVVMLAEFQEQVGPTPLSPTPGLTDALDEFGRSDKPEEALDRLCKTLANIENQKDQTRLADVQQRVKWDEDRYIRAIEKARSASR